MCLIPHSKHLEHHPCHLNMTHLPKKHQNPKGVDLKQRQPHVQRPLKLNAQARVQLLNPLPGAVRDQRHNPHLLLLDSNPHHLRWAEAGVETVMGADLANTNLKSADLGRTGLDSTTGI